MGSLLFLTAEALIIEVRTAWERVSLRNDALQPAGIV